MLKVLRPVAWLQAEHLALMGKLVRELDSEDVSLEAYLVEHAAGRLLAWEPQDQKALVLTKVVSFHREPCLWIEGVVGSGLLKVAHELRHDFALIAKHYGCVRAAGDAERPGLRAFYAKLGLVPLVVTFGMEIS